MAFSIAESQTRGLIYLGLRDDSKFDYDAFGCFYDDHGKITILYYLMEPENGLCPLREISFSDLKPPVKWYIVKRIKPIDIEHKRIPTLIDEERTQDLYRRFQRFIVLNFATSLPDFTSILQLEKSFREKMADQFYRGEIRTFDRASSPRPESPKSDPLIDLHSEIYRLREDIINKDACILRLNSLIQSLNRLINDRLPVIGLVPGYFDKECVVEVRPLHHGVKILLRSGKRIECNKPGVFQTLSLEELQECLKLVDSRSTERDQLTDIKREIVEQIMENEKQRFRV